jgi:hypothetical protein
MWGFFSRVLYQEILCKRSVNDAYCMRKFSIQLSFIVIHIQDIVSSG